MLRILKELLNEPFKSVLYPSLWRLRWLGMFVFVGNFLFYYIWSEIFPQEYESFPIRVFMSSLGIFILLGTKQILLQNPFWIAMYLIASFIQLPLFFLYMTYMNSYNAVWLGSSVSMVLIYYHTTDWRIATIGVFCSIIIILITQAIQPSISPGNTHIIFWIIFLFAWLSSIVTGSSTANLLKQNLLNTSFNLGVMAHELRTPISSINIIAHILKNKSIENKDSYLNELASKLNLLVKIINQHIDDQIANSKQQLNTVENSIFRASDCVQNAINNYPFKSKNEFAAAQLECLDEFSFMCNSKLMAQVLNNLIKNSLRAMYTKETSEQDMLLKFRIFKTQNRREMGVITLTDNGIGIRSKDLNRVLEPFVSSAGELGHGLGLPFCKKVMDSLGGNLLIQSEYGVGTTIRLEFPIVKTI